MGAPRQDAGGVWMYYTETGEFSHVMKPCAEHGDLPCTRHAGKGWPESKIDVHGSRVALGIGIIGGGIALYVLFSLLISSFGMWVLYAPVLAFVGTCASYLMGWGVTACCRVARK